jgi:hypothetical protein
VVAVRRRTFIAGLGSLTAAGAAAVGTGAFTSMSADRSVDVAVADDADALLSLTPVPGSANAAYVSTDGGTLRVDISDGNDGVLGEGVNTGATTVFADLFRVTNRGTQTVYLWLLESGGRNGSKRHAFYAGEWPADGSGDAAAVSVADFNNGIDNTRPRELQPQSDAGVDTAAVELGVGESVDVGLVTAAPPGSAGSAILKEGQTVELNATAEFDALYDVFTPVYDPA